MLSQIEDTLSALREPSSEALAALQHGVEIVGGALKEPSSGTLAALQHGVEVVGDKVTKRQRQQRRRSRLVVWLPLIAVIVVALVWVARRRVRQDEQPIVPDSGSS